VYSKLILFYDSNFVICLHVYMYIRTLKKVKCGIPVKIIFLYIKMQTKINLALLICNIMI